MIDPTDQTLTVHVPENGFNGITSKFHIPQESVCRKGAESAKKSNTKGFDRKTIGKACPKVDLLRSNSGG